jgi:hypothetical protein
VSAYAKVIADSKWRGCRLTTMEVRTWRFVLAEFNTHRKFSRNSASSRAIPFKKQIAKIEELGPAYPLSWPLEKPGMQGGVEMDAKMITNLRQAWGDAARINAQLANSMTQAGLHKSVANRLIEPYMWHTMIVSATEWQNFFNQRCSPLAQPEIRLTAEMMRDALDESTPVETEEGEWHLPYVEHEDYDAIYKVGSDVPREKRDDWPMMVSAARCARVSYLTHDGKRSIEADLDLYRKLRNAEPPHLSPMEHVATPGNLLTSNFDGWLQLRGMVEAVA